LKKPSLIAVNLALDLLQAPKSFENLEPAEFIIDEVARDDRHDSVGLEASS
jgi:hypothetical protein